MQRVDDDFRVGLVQAVMRGQVQADGPYQVVGTYQLSFFSLGEIAEVDEAELAISD